MKKQRKEELLNSFPALPEQFRIEMQGKGAANFVVFLTHGNELFARCYHRYSKGEIAERQRYVFAKDGCVRYGVDYKGKWSARSEFREPVFCANAYGYSFDNSYTVLNFDAILHSCMKYSMAKSYKNSLIIEYLHIYCKHPNIEYLMKAGYDVIYETVTGYWGGRKMLNVLPHINWKSNNLLKMLNLNRDEFKALKGNEHHYETYLRYREEFPKLKPDDVIAISKVFNYDVYTLGRFCDATQLSPQRISRYLDENKINRFDYRDYIQQCKKLKYNLCDTAYSMPHDFAEMHGRVSLLIKYKADKEIRQRFVENYDSRKCLEFSYKNLFIRQPSSYDEIVIEGTSLHHCVGGYADRHSKGTLTIMFIREQDRPDKPFYTVEVSKGGKVIQVRGLRNCDPTPEVEEFMIHYKAYINKIYKKKEKKTA